MKNKFNTIQFRLLFSFLASCFLAGVTYIIIFLIASIISINDYDAFILWINRNIIIFFTVSFVIFIILMSIYFFILTRGRVRYLAEITENLNTISKGDLKISIPVRYSDELGQLADCVNGMAGRLDRLIEEERRWERERNDLITNVSHDLRTPLTSVLGYIGLIKSTKYKDEESLKHYAKIAYDKCSTLRVLIENLFEYSKLNNSKMGLNIAEIDLRELLEQVIVGFIPKLEEAGMEYSLSFTDERIKVDADPVLLARMFDNLIANAINYGKDGNLLRVEIKKQGDYPIVCITNYGITIPENDLPYIFERFYRVDKSRSSKVSGSGLGLAIVKSIADKHGFNLKVISIDNTTTFEVILHRK